MCASRQLHWDNTARTAHRSLCGAHAVSPRSPDRKFDCLSPILSPKKVWCQLMRTAKSSSASKSELMEDGEGPRNEFGRSSKRLS